MEKIEQIGEMARIIGHCESTLHPVIECHNKATGCYCIENPCHNQRIADKLYNAGYRKQAWISVEERLPTEEEYRDECGELIPLLVCEKDTRYPYRAMYDGVEWGDGLMKICGITHWMPLPEPPKGGVEE